MNRYSPNSNPARKLDTLCLTADQISDLLIADDPTALSLASRQRHLQQCPECNQEFTHMESLLGSLRYSATMSAARVQKPASKLRVAADSNRHNERRSSVWALVAATLAAAFALPFVHHAGADPLAAVNTFFSRPAATAKAAPAVTTEAGDEALLQGISQDLSASVPSSLELLADPASRFANAQPVDDDDAPR
ncbi:hypothetical protein FTO74_17925 [Granulicella sp. WH15]|uniref:hypothetical protein n=1 Tax=Granulicella sp. WH15 TaxID=2602070 RepID=UPI00136778C9|nr:hypothetical protein [Granulicella sp. WH15]QHN05022.1 hypothetical protein FTO74_17925 [Granulicella sp. WH15]